MKYIKKFHFLIFPFLIIIFGTLVLEVFNYEANTTSILFICGLSFLLSPKVKSYETQSGIQYQVTWLFLKKSFKE